MTQIEPLPGTRPFRILCGGCVRKPANVLSAHLASLEQQRLPEHVRLDFAFVDDNTDPASSALLQEWVLAREGYYSDMRQGETHDFSDTGITHHWTGPAMDRVGALKNGIFARAMDEGYDACWQVDSDLVLGPNTLWSLYHADRPIVCGVFWTYWQETPDQIGVPLPQAWLRHPYQLDGRGMDAIEFLRRLQAHEMTQVWGQGACTLYRTDVLRKGVSYERVPGLPTEGLWRGEDRHLCVRAERLHIPMFADPWPRIFHCYHQRQQDGLQAWFAKLDHTKQGDHPVMGDWVSLILRPLEPVLDSGRATMVMPEHVRGRLGRLPLVPDLEGAIQEMVMGDKRIVSVAYPAWDAGPFRGQKRLIQVTLVDWMDAAAERVNTI